jgi:hypothetical protein
MIHMRTCTHIAHTHTRQHIYTQTVTRAATPRTPAPKPTSTALVPAQLAKLNLPLVGATIKANNSVWVASKVLCVTTNYVQVDKHERKEKPTEPPPVTLRAGLKVQLRLPPRDDQVTTLLLVSVGLIYAATSRYRAAIIRRKIGEEPYGPLETMNASSFPNATHCNVYPHSQSLLPQQQHNMRHTLQSYHTHRCSNMVPPTPKWGGRSMRSSSANTSANRQSQGRDS